MKFQKIYTPDVEEDLKAIFESWPEISYEKVIKSLEDIDVVYIIPKEEDFAKVSEFETKEEAMGAFRSLIQEYGFEDYPENVAFLHSDFDGDKLFLLLKAKNSDNIERFDQLSVEKLTKQLPNFQRVVMYESAILTYLKDVYPAIDSVAYVISQKLSNIGCKTPDLKDIAKIYGFMINTKEDELRLIEKIVNEDLEICPGKKLPPMDIPVYG